MRFEPNSDWAGVKVVVDPYLPTDQAFLIQPDTLIFSVAMRPRTWWKPWTWRSRPLTMEERWSQLGASLGSESVTARWRDAAPTAD